MLEGEGMLRCSVIIFLSPVVKDNEISFHRKLNEHLEVLVERFFISRPRNSFHNMQ